MHLKFMNKQSERESKRDREREREREIVSSLGIAQNFTHTYWIKLQSPGSVNLLLSPVRLSS